MQRTWFAPVIALLVCAVGLAACDGMTGADSDGKARLRVHMIDAPFPFDLVESTNVTISRVEVHSETGGSVTISDEAAQYNLLDLQEGVFAPLGDVTVEPGTYHSVRLYVEDATIVLIDGTVFDLKVPSDRIKVLVDDLTIQEGEDVTLTIDFDVSKSFVVQGHPDTPAGIKGFLFKPTVVPAGIDRRQHDDEVEG